MGLRPRLQSAPGIGRWAIALCRAAQHDGVEMFSHIFVGADDVAVAKKFYDAALGVLGVAEGKIDPKGRCFYRTPTGTLGIGKPLNGQPATARKR